MKIDLTTQEAWIIVEALRERTKTMDKAHEFTKANATDNLKRQIPQAVEAEV